MLKSLANSGHSRDKKLMGEAQQMLQDSKAKIEYLKMRIVKVRQGRGSLRSGGYHDQHNGDLSDKDQLGKQLEPPGLEDRVEELRHRLRIEAAVVEGAKNVIRSLQSSKAADKKALQEVSFLKYIFGFYFNSI
ncbi:hypothetical protein O3M35_001623 [Rhynocoris fuscipes]|uniref:REM-1 domain-containing protein n=1 Tax=Rhynocoris fuscipes TaxID=488301 RepID=A0AAW1CPL3_9HEMI